MFAAVTAALAFAGSASAQNAGSSAQPAPGPTAITVPAAGCSTCGNATASRAHACLRGFAMQSAGGYWLSNCPNGMRCNNGAGSFRADLGFAFGPSRSFFDPCGPRILPDCGGAGGAGCGKCRTPILGRGPAGPWSPCVYDVYQNH
jgi:hypothetical protein